VERIGGGFSMLEPARKPLMLEAQDVAIALLIHALEDITLLGSHRGLMEDTGARICDRAAWALHRIQPETYSFSYKAGRRQRELERITMINTWRTANNLELLPVPAAPPELEPQHALQITHFADLSPEVTAGEALREKVITLVGTDFQGNTLPSLIQWIASTPVTGIRGVEIDVRRNKDLRGVEIEMRLQAGESTTIPSDWRIQLQGKVGERTLYHNPRSSQKDPREDRYWQEIIGEITAALHVPPETEFLIQAEIVSPYSVTF
jgi:hypothetical protein